MKILHYAFGFPPYRTGGLTKFCIDLLQQQNKMGHQVALMWPGTINLFNKKTQIRKRGDVVLDGSHSQIGSFEVINPLPVSYDEGIYNISEFTKDVEEDIYTEFINDYKPDIVHVHTLMGLHKAFLSSAKRQGVRLVFTSHDFFPICPKVTIFRLGKICPSRQSCEECGVCNTTALGMNKIMILQSPLYRKMKDSTLVKKLRKRHRDAYLSESTLSIDAVPVGTKEEFKKLREYYFSMLKMMDIIHYNSSVTRAVYESFFYLPKSCVISMTHADVNDNRTNRDFSCINLRIRYLGPAGGGKGFFLLKEALDKLWSVRQDFCLDVHFTPSEISPYIKVHGRYSYEDLGNIFAHTDVLIIPSIWYETFGYTALEALSYGIPVIMSGTVGAKDILEEGAGIVVNNITSVKLYEVIRGLTREKLKAMNKIILDKQSIMTLDRMANEIEEICYKGDLNGNR